MNTAATDAAFNGLPAYPIKHTDGSDLSRQDVIPGEEYIFIWNGTNFSSTLMNVPKKPPQYVFYVRTDSTSVITGGLESNTGFANTPQDAFKGINTGMATIEATYISTQSITIMVADGVYYAGPVHNSQYISAYVVQGNDSNPSACIIDATAGGTCAASLASGHLTIHGFTFKSYVFNVAANVGYMDCYNCNFTSPVNSNYGTLEAVLGGSIILHGNIGFSTPVACSAFAYAHNGGYINFGSHASGSAPITCNFTFQGTCTGQFFIMAIASATVVCYNDGTVTINGGPFQGTEYLAQSAGGVGFSSGVSAFPATSPGIVDPPGYVW
jgi:hypothetical protein